MFNRNRKPKKPNNFKPKTEESVLYDSFDTAGIVGGITYDPPSSDSSGENSPDSFDGGSGGDFGGAGSSGDF